VAQYGLRGWEEVQREIIHIQKQQKAAQLAAQKEHEESMHQLKVLGMAALLVVMLVIGMIVTISLSMK
jgi:hypothetical protein